MLNHLGWSRSVDEIIAALPRPTEAGAGAASADPAALTQHSGTELVALLREGAVRGSTSTCTAIRDHQHMHCHP